MPYKERDILVIDDSPGIRTFLNVSFGGAGARIHEAPNADTGLRLFETVKPDVVILDLGLPDKDGLDILPELCTANGGKQAPVIVLTVRSDTYTRTQAMERGASGYVTKPFMMEELYECLHDVMQH